MNRPSIEIKNSQRFHEWLQDHRLTDNARRMLRHAHHRAPERGLYGVIPAAMILLATLRWERKIGVIVLEKCGVDLSALERDLEHELQRLPEFEVFELDCSRLSEVAAMACEESKALGHTWVGSEHLLLGLFRSGDEIVARLFRKHGITPEAYRPKLLELLNG